MNTTTQLSQQKVTFRTKINYCILFENLARKTTNTEAQTIRTTDAYGTKIAYMDGKSIRSKDKYGNKLFYLDGNTIKQKDNYGEKVCYIDGQTIRTKDAYGEKLYFFEGIPEKWGIICLMNINFTLFARVNPI